MFHKSNRNLEFLCLLNFAVDYSAVMFHRLTTCNTVISLATSVVGLYASVLPTRKACRFACNARMYEHFTVSTRDTSTAPLALTPLVISLLAGAAQRIDGLACNQGGDGAGLHSVAS